jgi:hypothetical protein
VPRAVDDAAVDDRDNHAFAGVSLEVELAGPGQGGVVDRIARRIFEQGVERRAFVRLAPGQREVDARRRLGGSDLGIVVDRAGVGVLQELGAAGPRHGGGQRIDVAVAVGDLAVQHRDGGGQAVATRIAADDDPFGVGGQRRKAEEEKEREGQVVAFHDVALSETWFKWCWEVALDEQPPESPAGERDLRRASAQSRPRRGDPRVCIAMPKGAWLLCVRIPADFVREMRQAESKNYPSSSGSR